MLLITLDNTYFMLYFKLCPNDWDLSHIHLFIIVP